MMTKKLLQCLEEMFLPTFDLQARPGGYDVLRRYTECLDVADFWRFFPWSRSISRNVSKQIRLPLIR